MFEKVTIRQIPLQAVENLEKFANYLINEQGVQRGKLMAINAEKIILSERSEIAKILQQGEWNYADGISVVCSIRKKYPQHRALERIAGADLWLALMARAARWQVPVFLIGARNDVINEVREKLLAQNVPIAGWQDGYFDNEAELIARVKQSGARLVTVAMGSPKQEQLMIRLQQAHPEALYMGVGGSYDVFVGRVKRAPKMWQKCGLEWLYRLLRQPTRWRRQRNLLKYAYYHLTNQL